MPTPIQPSQANRAYGYYQINSDGDALFPNGAVGLSELSLSCVAQLDPYGVDDTPRLLFNAEKSSSAEECKAFINAYISDTTGVGYISIGTTDGVIGTDGSVGEASLLLDGSDLTITANALSIFSDTYIDGTLQLGNVPLGAAEINVLVVDSDGNVKIRSDFTVSNYTNASPTPTTIGGISAGSTFINQTMQQMWDALLYPYQAPSFGSFSISGQSTTVEVGTSIAGSQTFIWSTSNSSNVQANSISIVDLTNTTTLATGLANDGSESVLLPSTVVKTSASSNTWRITGTNSNSTSFTADFVVNWYWKIYYGTNINTTLTEAQIEALINTSLTNNITGSFAFAGGNYKYFCYPDVYGSINTIKDAATSLNVAMASSIDDAFFSNSANGIYYGVVSVTNVNGVSTNYRVYRSKNILGGSITFIIT